MMKDLLRLALTLGIITVFNFASNELTAQQDVHFSQFNAAPMQINPAHTGLFDGQVRVGLNYRNQYSAITKLSAYKTYATSLDFRFDKGFAAYDNFGIGLTFFTDKAGDTELRNTYFTFSTAYIKNLTRFRNQYISVGMHAGFDHRSINYSNVQTGSMWDGDKFNEDLPTGELFDFEKFSMLELGAGFTWFYAPDDRVNFYAGLGVYHINQPNISFFRDVKHRYIPRVDLNGGMAFPLTDEFELLPSILIMKQGPNLQITPGTYLKYVLNSNSSIYLGTWLRIGTDYDSSIFPDALIVTTRLDYNKWQFGVSYDITVSDLNRGNNKKGGIELSAIYIGSAHRRHKTLHCPRF